ncbi:MAG: enoyl-CoA hydratase-related protein [Castellaniella sp.]
MKYECIRLSIEGNTATLTLNRPQVLNALNNQMIAEALHAVEGLPESTRLLVLRGADGVSLAAGADLNEMKQRSIWSELDFGKRRTLAERLSQGNFVTLAAIEGYALGGGLELALACHLRVASSNAIVGLPETRLGFIPGNGGAARLTRLVGVGRALQMILLGEHVKAEQALEYGIVNWVYPEEQFDEQLAGLKERLVRLAPLATHAVIDSVEKAVDMSLSHAIENEQRWFQICMESPDKQEGLAAFFEKRRAKFSARFPK